MRHTHAFGLVWFVGWKFTVVGPHVSVLGYYVIHLQATLVAILKRNERLYALSESFECLRLCALDRPPVDHTRSSINEWMILALVDVH